MPIKFCGRYFLFLASLTFLSALVGCGGSGHDTAPASGKVTFDGGPPPAPGQIFFTVISAPEGKSRPASASFDKEGNFSVTSWEPGDGLVPGTYKAKVECWKTAPSPDGTPGVSHVAAGTEPQEIVIPESGKTDIVIDVPAAK